MGNDIIHGESAPVCGIKQCGLDQGFLPFGGESFDSQLMDGYMSTVQSSSCTGSFPHRLGGFHIINETGNLDTSILDQVLDAPLFSTLPPIE